MREELLPHPQDTHSWFTAWKLYTAPNGCYAAKRDIRYDIHFDEPRTKEDIAYSNDRYRLMHEMYQKHPSPIQTPRWLRSIDAEFDNPYTFWVIDGELYVWGTFDCFLDAFKSEHKKRKEDPSRRKLMAREKSTLSDQDLEDLVNSKVAFGLTKDNIAHIESSLAAKDYDATYAHHFWVQMGKDCNWEPLTLALYYFRYRDKKEFVSKEYLLQKGFEWIEDCQSFELGDMGVVYIDNMAKAWKVSYTINHQNFAERRTEYVRYTHEMDVLLDKLDRLKKPVTGKVTFGWFDDNDSLPKINNNKPLPPIIKVDAEIKPSFESTRPAKCKDCKFCTEIVMFEGGKTKYTCKNSESERANELIKLQDLACSKWKLIHS